MNQHTLVEITINDVIERVPLNSTLQTIIFSFGEADPDLIVEMNGRFVYPREYAVRTVKTGDRLEFINPNFGG
jgi:thiamine biosynthesis protein ThiS